MVIEDAAFGDVDLNDATTWRDTFSLDYAVAYDPSGTFISSWNPSTSVPRGWVIDRDGTIVYRGGSFQLMKAAADILLNE